MSSTIMKSESRSAVPAVTSLTELAFVRLENTDLNEDG